MQIEADYIQQFNSKRGLVFVPDLIVDGIKTSIQEAQPFDTKEAALSEAEAVIKRYRSRKRPTTDKALSKAKGKVNYDKPNESAAASLKLKMEAIRNTIDSMTEEQYGDWADSLTFDEFIELIRLGEK